MSAKPSDADADRELAQLLRALISPRLGHTLEPWPSALRLALDRIARARRTSPLALARDLLARPDAEALDALVSAATVPHTRFFRHPEHFERLARELPRIVERRGAPVRIWCAGCATGEEPWSVALLASQLGIDIELLATDVSPEALRTARAGIYPRVIGGAGAPIAIPSSWSAPDALRRVVRFERASITEPDPDRGAGPFDVVLCRNVLIYFPAAQAAAIASRLAARLRPGGAMIVAPVEALVAIPPSLRHGDPLGWLEPPSSAARIAAAPPAFTAPSVDELERAARALGLGELDEAERALRAALEITPTRAEAWFLLGETLEKRGERAQARAAFRCAASHADTTPHGRTLASAAQRRARD
ncbi:CheR family methyltransferase [Sandaracinus amylolyticus]|uniref:Chemotaxis protein methyltransferase CheR n=1 Tax=Sandaracinus amylolyticus TaxID=927083 RepID=A0A0F6YGI4_9BACT|nr:CheR family methyltransferase [Sandaracinus amylolyticus]AKF04751.1 Chemotaxis protein methyltransferase CheR [Sandaracinus amylolyticus]